MYIHPSIYCCAVLLCSMDVGVAGNGYALRERVRYSILSPESIPRECSIMGTYLLKKSNSNTFSVRYHSTFLSFFHSYLHHSAQHTGVEQWAGRDLSQGLVWSVEDQGNVLYCTVR